MSEKMELAAECQRVASYCIEQMPIYQAQDLLRKAAVDNRASPAAVSGLPETLPDSCYTWLSTLRGHHSPSEHEANGKTRWNLLRNEYNALAPPRAAVSPPQREDAIALANDYQRGLDRMETAGYEEFSQVIPKHRLIIKALRALALYPAGDGREADSVSGETGK